MFIPRTVLALAVLFCAAPAYADSIQTFRQFCLAHAPDSAAIKGAGERAGFDFSDFPPNGYIGFRRATDETLQINVATRHQFECAVTTSSAGNPVATGAAFFSALGLTPNRREARGLVRGEVYTFRYDPRGGEAFVMYRQ